MERKYQICKRCVMDTTDPDIVFDEKGFCNHCTSALRKLKEINVNLSEKEKKLGEIAKEIKRDGEGKKYDCVIGLSGGLDSSYLAYIVVNKLKLRPLAVHVDNGWNSELAVKNIENIITKLKIDLYTHVINWEEFKDLQLSYLKASVIDLEVLSDNAIVVTIHKMLKKHKLKYFLIGYNQNAESIMPASWLFSPKYDSLNIKSIYNRFGNGLRLKTYPLLSLFGFIDYRYFDKSRNINILDLIDYNKHIAKNILTNELGWRDYGAKHFESRITLFYQAYILPNKFNVDKRRAHLSSLICSNQISRQEALIEIDKPLYPQHLLDDELEYFLKKLGISRLEFREIMDSPRVTHHSFPSYKYYFSAITKWLKPKSTSY